jgi:hypothetical protein
MEMQEEVITQLMQKKQIVINGMNLMIVELIYKIKTQ